jgi:hypothetical protein
MDINPNRNSQKQAIDLSQLPLPNHLPGKGASAPKEPEISTDTPGASSVSLSEEGRAASFKFDFNATADNFSKLNALSNSDSFAKAHASISYENVKNLLD